MTDGEKAIRILEGNYKDFVLRHNGELLTVNQLIALLKEQEARMLTQDEIIDYNGYIWKEYKETSIMTVSEIKMGIERVPYNGNCSVKEMNWATYKKLWRCWTEKPTEEQRKAVKWE